MIYSLVDKAVVVTMSQHLFVALRKFSSSGVVMGSSVSMANCSRVRCLGGKCVHFHFYILSGGLGCCWHDAIGNVCLTSFLSSDVSFVVVILSVVAVMLTFCGDVFRVIV